MNSGWQLAVRRTAAHVPIAVVVLAALTVAVPLAHAHFTWAQQATSLQSASLSAPQAHGSQRDGLCPLCFAFSPLGIGAGPADAEIVPIVLTHERSAPAAPGRRAPRGPSAPRAPPQLG